MLDQQKSQIIVISQIILLGIIITASPPGA